VTVIRFNDRTLMLHSPVALEPPLKRALDELGQVRWIVGPSRVHHVFIGGWFGPHRLIRFAIRDRGAARRSIDCILEWDFDRIIMSHGAVVASGGRAVLKEAFAFLPS
jgi:hypothetical protein